MTARGRPKGTGRPFTVVISPVLVEIFEVRDQPAAVATRAYLRDCHATGVVHVRYVAINQESVEYWDVVVDGVLCGRCLSRERVRERLSRFNLALPMVEAI